MVRKVRKNEWVVGLSVHYWGNNYRVWSVTDDDVLLVVPGEQPNGWYQPFATELTKPTSVTVKKDDEFVMIFDDKKLLPWEK
ncbi:hypothetical protein [Nostoc sp. TCL240-02]|uniref:hypothetical protein n=1 Tax=Nostoc sp. TCL240-02 TaxID=2572090 RepID=UPI00157F7FDB|nr:hypothetical protein [Nostoc sp. TCL240-02]QKQ76363.1 hypothetical protein FBB35_26500 [Nostoc sp. TCL240-02]